MGSMIHLFSMLFPLILVATTLLNADTASAVGGPTQPSFFDYSCVNTTGNYTASSAYQSNLLSVLTDLRSNASLSPFYNTSAGLGADTVYGQYYCRGDIDGKLCGDCIQQAAQSVFGNCTLFRTAAIWYQECTLRYSNQSMVGIRDILPLTGSTSKQNATNTDALLSVLHDTMNGLIKNSTEGAKPSLFGTGEGKVSAFETVYCLVQCSPDLSGSQCDSCLRLAYLIVSQWSVPMPLRISVFFASCQMRYSSGLPFYEVSNEAPATPLLPPSPSALINPLTPPTTTSNTTKGGSVVLRSSGVGVVMTALTSLLLLLKM